MARSVDLLLAVAAGSAAGGVARYLLSESLQARAGTAFPLGTLLVNLTGCLALGFIAHVVLSTGEFSPTTRALLTTGFCGGFTTFSAFAYETVSLMEEGSWLRASMNVGMSVGIGLVGIFAGAMAAKWLLHLMRGGVA